MNRDDFIATARKLIGHAYRWGGDGPEVFDCSGFILYCLRAAGLDLPDMRAVDIARKFQGQKIALRDAKPGCFFFYGKREIDHVMACLDRWPDGHIVLVGARGGNYKTVDYETAYSQKAIVDVVTGDYWKSQLVLVVDPFEGEL